MKDIEQYAAENARLKAVLEKQGFKITYASTGEIKRISPPRRPVVRHTAINWAKKRGYKNSVHTVDIMVKRKAITLRKFKNLVERAELIKEAKNFLEENGYKIPAKYFDKVPTYILKDHSFQENVNNSIYYSTDETEKELSPDEIRKTIDTSIKRIRNAHKKAYVRKR